MIPGNESGRRTSWWWFNSNLALLDDGPASARTPLKRPRAIGDLKVRDLHATILNQLGIDHWKFTVKWQGVDMKLTGVDAEAQVVKEILA
jgi:hypothetical protein